MKRIIINFRNYFLLIFFIFFLTGISFKNFNYVFALDTYSSSTPLKDIINKSDPTTYKGIELIKKEKIKTSDGRLGDHSNKYEATFYLFEAKYQYSNNIKIWVNSEFKTSEKIVEIALRYSKMLGQIPDYFRSELKWVVIHGPWVDKAKCTCAWYAFRNEGFYIHTEMIPNQQEEEILIHELAHVTIDSLYYNAENEFSISQNLMITSDTQTMSCYILKASAIAELLESVRFSVDNLSRGGAGFAYAIDRVWKRLQQRMFFALTKGRLARQRPSFSDIENSHQDYGL